METWSNPLDIRWADRLSATYEDSRLQWIIDRIQEITLNCVKMMKSPQSILDVGCGTGRLLRKLHECRPEASLIGIDPSEGMIREARRLMRDATFYVAWAEALPLPDASVDLILSTLSFHHWTEPAKGVHEMARVLRPEGQVVIADAVLPYGLSMFIRHFNQSELNAVRKLFIEGGLEIQVQRRVMMQFLGVTIGIKRTSGILSNGKGA